MNTTPEPFQYLSGETTQPQETPIGPTSDQACAVSNLEEQVTVSLEHLRTDGSHTDEKNVQQEPKQTTYITDPDHHNGQDKLGKHAPKATTLSPSWSLDSKQMEAQKKAGNSRANRRPSGGLTLVSITGKRNGHSFNSQSND